ncbi:MAG TPA: YHS domain-containing protein [Polyangiaceae bacterium]|nr:YHS domain-containing protein [Polyangiaceae bacterium]
MTESAIDPVCGMTVNPSAARGGSHTHEGQTYYFCNPRCRERFAANPGQYLAPKPGESDAHATHAHAHAATPAVAAPPLTSAGDADIYTCPILSLRARSGDAHVDHGRHGAWRGAGSARQAG